jgi:hypothetical protein
MNIEDENNPSAWSSLCEFMISGVIKEKIFTLQVNVGTSFSIQCAITITLYSEMISQEFIRFGSMWSYGHRTVYDCECCAHGEVMDTRNLFN